MTLMAIDLFISCPHCLAMVHPDYCQHGQCPVCGFVLPKKEASQ